MQRPVIRPPKGERYEIRVCSRCDSQVERNGINDRWTCPNHGDHITIRVAEVQLARLVFGKPLVTTTNPEGGPSA